jgi:hypothetical protein
MEIENFILKYYHETGIWLPTGKKDDDDPCNGRECTECEIGGCKGDA